MSGRLYITESEFYLQNIRYKLLETRGVALDHESLPRRLAEAGCLLDADDKRVRMPREVVEAAIRSAPSKIELWNIAGDSFSDLSGDNVHFTPGSAAIKMLDEKTHQMRPVSIDDMLRYGKLVEQLDAIDYSSTAVVPNDAPQAIGDSIRLYALLKTTSKAIVTGAFTIEGFNVMAEMLLAVRGTAEALRARPFTIFTCCPTTPQKWNAISVDNVVRCAELGIPAEIVPMPMAGLVSPITLVGCVIQHTAETLSGVVISQTARPDAPILYGGSPGAFDMRTMAATVSAVEAQMIGCAYVEVGKYLGLPTQTYTGLSDSKTLDAQAGFESGGGLYLAGLAGVNSISGPGMHYFQTSLSLEKLVFDAQICDITRRLTAGLEPREDFPADALFDELLQEENLLTADHTLKYFRQEHCIPGPLIDRTQLQGSLEGAARRPPGPHGASPPRDRRPSFALRAAGHPLRGTAPGSGKCHDRRRGRIPYQLLTGHRLAKKRGKTGYRQQICVRFRLNLSRKAIRLSSASA